jgi:hypothetical protein
VIIRSVIRRAFSAPSPPGSGESNRRLIAYRWGRLATRPAAPKRRYSEGAQRIAAVTSWNDPDVTIDGMIYVWPEHASDVRQLFES